MVKYSKNYHKKEEKNQIVQPIWQVGHIKLPKTYDNDVLSKLLQTLLKHCLQIVQQTSFPVHIHIVIIIVIVVVIVVVIIVVIIVVDVVVDI